MELHTIGIDLGKTIFHLVGLNPRGEVVVGEHSCFLHDCLSVTSETFTEKCRGQSVRCS
jgi:hypothetical protein